MASSLLKGCQQSIISLTKIDYGQIGQDRFKGKGETKSKKAREKEKETKEHN
ncbi:MAG: hypothetical protein ACW97W_09680 [Candidatus Hodarchaeales archaeon]|jgi:hypothetical protein